MFLVENERTKLTASWLNSLAVAVIAAGVFAPAAALVYGLSQLSMSVGSVSGIVMVCFAIGLILHWLARLLLGRLRE